MKCYILKFLKWILDYYMGLLLIGFAVYLMSTKEWKLGGVYLLTCGLFSVHRTKIGQLETKIINLENMVKTKS